MRERNPGKNTEFIIFKTEDEQISVDVRIEDDTIWLTQGQIAELYGTARPGITQHIKTFLPKANCRKIQLVRNSYELPQTAKTTTLSTITSI